MIDTHFGSKGKLVKDIIHKVWHLSQHRGIAAQSYVLNMSTRYWVTKWALPLHVRVIQGPIWIQSGRKSHYIPVKDLGGYMDTDTGNKTITNGEYWYICAQLFNQCDTQLKVGDSGTCHISEKIRSAVLT